MTYFGPSSIESGTVNTLPIVNAPDLHASSYGFTISG